MIEDLASGQSSYAWLVKSHEDASLCVECGACEQVCPQHIPINAKLKHAHTYLGLQVAYNAKRPGTTPRPFCVEEKEGTKHAKTPGPTFPAF
jgi:ferredoxin